MLTERLRKCRNIKKATQKDVADYLGIATTSYQKYELGTREPNIDTLNRLADYFETSTDYLLGRNEKYRLNEDGHLTVNIPPDFINWSHEEILKYYKERRVQAEKEKESE